MNINGGRSFLTVNQYSQVIKYFFNNINIENNYALREELELLKEESLFQNEELSKY